MIGSVNNPAAATDEPVPLAQHGCSLVEMIDRVNADQGVERAVVEGEPPACIGANEPRALGEAALERGLVRFSDAGLGLPVVQA